MGDLPKGRHGRETTCNEATENKTVPDATAANEAAPGGAAPNETAPDGAAGGDRKRHPHREDALIGPAGVIRRAGAFPTGLRVGS
jgi:hypothetical protein